jgi:hypothetical protein
MKQKLNDNKECECRDWATDGRIPLLSHHYKCDNYSPVNELTEIIKDLLKGIESWAAEEDGVYCFDAYKKAKVAMGQFNFIEEK